jgi:hypothetical protein
MLAAIVLTMLLAISSFGHAIEFRGPEVNQDRLRNFRLASSTAFLGLMYCVIMAPLVESNVFEQFQSSAWFDSTLAGPVATMLLWAFFHLRASRQATIEELVKALDEQLDLAIVDYVKSRPAKSATRNDIYDNCAGNRASILSGSQYNALRQAHLHGRGEDILNFVQRVSYTPERVDGRLQHLVDEDELKRVNGHYQIAK